MEMYLITFKTPGKSYVGISSKSAAHRWKHHIRPSNKMPIGRAFQKYGVADATLTVLADCDSWPELCAMEIAAIAELKTMAPSGYNVAVGGHRGMLGFKHSEEERVANQILGKKRFESPEFKAKLLLASKNYWATSESRNAAAKRAKKLWSSPEFKTAISASRKLTHNTPEYRAASSAKGKQRFESPESIAAASAIAKQSMSRPHVKAAMSASQRKRFESLEARKLASEKTKTYFASPAARQIQRSATATANAKKAGRPFSYIPKLTDQPL